MRHFSHHRNIPHAHHGIYLMLIKYAYSKSRHDSYPQFPGSSLGTRGLQTDRQKKETTAFLESRSAKASSTKKQCTAVRNVDFEFRIDAYVLYASSLIVEAEVVCRKSNVKQLYY